MTSSNSTFHGSQVNSGQVKRLKRSNFEINIFLHTKNIFLTQNFLRISNMPLVFLYDLQNTKNCKNVAMPFSLYNAIKKAKLIFFIKFNM